MKSPAPLLLLPCIVLSASCQTAANHPIAHGHPSACIPISDVMLSVEQNIFVQP